MMYKSIDGHTFEEISKGFYKAINPYEINADEWILDITHSSYAAITSIKNEPFADLLYVCTSEGYSAFTETLKTLRESASNIGLIYCIKPAGEEIGGLSAYDVDF